MNKPALTTSAGKEVDSNSPLSVQGAVLVKWAVATPTRSSCWASNPSHFRFVINLSWTAF